ncbi:TPA: TetR/AcrR family transcriptional regulator [Klebsiella oxytoca]
MKTIQSTRGRPKSGEVSFRVESLLDIAAKVFMEAGFRDAKMIDIAKRAGASKTTLYNLYPTKNDLFRSVISRKIKLLEEQLNSTLTFDNELPVLLHSFGRKLIDTLMHGELRSLFNIVITERNLFPELAEFFWQAGPGNCIKILGQYLDIHPDFTGKNSLLSAEIFVSLCWGTFLLRSLLIHNFHMSDEEIDNHLTKSVGIFVDQYCRET